LQDLQGVHAGPDPVVVVPDRAGASGLLDRRHTVGDPVFLLHHRQLVLPLPAAAVRAGLMPSSHDLRGYLRVPTDGVADQLNAKWLQENGAYAGFKTAEPAVVPASYATPAVANDWGDRLVSRAMKYLGTPYRYGGTSPGGFDCSGFVYYLYGAVFGQRIPRMPHDMAREGTPVGRSDLKRGDLVFFGYRGTFTHVGIYAGNGQFVHATHRGSPVMVTPLDGDYYRDRYMTAVRLSPR